MNKKKKIIIGSIGAVVLILLTSFTVVIGKQANSETITNSPLFAIRIQKTINGEQKQITSYYLGKGKESKLSIFNRDIRIESLQKIIERISKMSDAQLAELAGVIGSNKMVNENRQQILRLLFELKNDPGEIKKQLSIIPKDSSHITRGCPPTTFPLCNPSCQWFLGCSLWWIWVFLNYVLIIIISILLGDNYS
jgi:hypothetical protein